MTAAEFLAESKRIAEAATPGPWGHYSPRNSPWPHPDPVFGSTPGDEVAWTRRNEDWRFIAHARQALPRMREALEAVIHELRESERSALQGPGRSGHETVWAVRRAIESALAENGGTDV